MVNIDALLTMCETSIRVPFYKVYATTERLAKWKALASYALLPGNGTLHWACGKACNYISVVKNHALSLFWIHNNPRLLLGLLSEMTITRFMCTDSLSPSACISWSGCYTGHNVGPHIHSEAQPQDKSSYGYCREIWWSPPMPYSSHTGRKGKRMCLGKHKDKKVDALVSFRAHPVYDLLLISLFTTHNLPTRKNLCSIINSQFKLTHTYPNLWSHSV